MPEQAVAAPVAPAAGRAPPPPPPPQVGIRVPGIPGEEWLDPLRTSTLEYEVHAKAAACLHRLNRRLRTKLRELKLAEVGDDDDDVEDACTVCWVRPKTHAFIPCGHKIMCGECCKDYHPLTVRTGYRLNTKCPLCREGVLLPAMQVFNS